MLSVKISIVDVKLNRSLGISLLLKERGCQELKCP